MTWKLKGYDYSSWEKEITTQELRSIVRSFRSIENVRISYGSEQIRFSVISRNGVGEHLHIHKHERVASKWLTS